MSFRDVYVGDLEDPNFDLENGNWSGNFPEQLSPLFPAMGGDSNTWGVYSNVYALSKSGELPAAQTDWGCWVVIVTRDQLLKYLDEWYGDGPIHPPDWTIDEGETREDNEIRLFVRNLDPKKNYALVALET